MVARRAPVREALLEQARERGRAAGQKVSRLERRGGVRVRANGLDPRVSAGEVAAMSTRQLRAYVGRLNRFTSRDTSYIAGRGGTPLNGATVRAYQRAERAYNRIAEGFQASIADMRIPTVNLTIAEQAENVKRRRGMFGDYRSFDPITPRNIGNITGQEQLNALLVQMEKRSDPKYLEREARLSRRIMRKMLEDTGNRDIVKVIRDLDDADLIMLSQHMGFMRALEDVYAMSASISSDSPRWQSQVLHDSQQAVRELADYAENGFGRPAPAGDDDATGSSRRTGRRAAGRRPARSTGTTPKRDRFGRFAGSESRPDPKFARDPAGRFTGRKDPQA